MENHNVPISQNTRKYARRVREWERSQTSIRNEIKIHPEINNKSRQNSCAIKRCRNDERVPEWKPKGDPKSTTRLNKSLQYRSGNYDAAKSVSKIGPGCGSGRCLWHYTRSRPRKLRCMRNRRYHQRHSVGNQRYQRYPPK